MLRRFLFLTGLLALTAVAAPEPAAAVQPLARSLIPTDMATNVTRVHRPRGGCCYSYRYRAYHSRYCWHTAVVTCCGYRWERCTERHHYDHHCDR
jgi:hypothetical protein